jgi:hypothetical protein
MLKVRIPCPRYIYEYCLNQFGEPIRLGKHHQINRLVKAKLSKPPAKPEPPIEGYYITVHLPFYQYPDPRVYCHLPKKAMEQIVQAIDEDILMEDFLRFMKHGTRLEIEHQVLINAFIDRRGMSEDSLSYETLKKRYYRIRLQQNNFRKSFEMEGEFVPNVFDRLLSLC